MARGAILLSNEVPFLWEWLPAAIIAVRRGGLPQKNIQLHWKPKFTRRANPAEFGVSAGGGPQRQSAAGGKRNAEIGFFYEAINDDALSPIPEAARHGKPTDLGGMTSLPEKGERAPTIVCIPATFGYNMSDDSGG